MSQYVAAPDIASATAYNHKSVARDRNQRLRLRTRRRCRVRTRFPLGASVTPAGYEVMSQSPTVSGPILVLEIGQRIIPHRGLQ
jgi:hypothetical protein